MDWHETVALVAINVLLCANAVLVLHRVLGPG
jgi:hypothetical protein